MGQATAGETADDGDHEALGQLGSRLEQPGDRAQQHVRGLERLDPSDEQEYRGVGGQP